MVEWRYDLNRAICMSSHPATHRCAKQRLRTVIRVVAMAALLSQMTPCVDGARPNVVFIMTDDQGPWALSSTGDPNVSTPQLDRLRRSGALLTRCYTPTPVCSPARAAVLTSRYGTEIGIEDFLTRDDRQSGLTNNLPAWPQLLSDSGYATALIGKYHCGQTVEAHPTNIGYGEFTGFIHGGMVSQNPRVEINGRQQPVQGWTPDILTDFAIDFVRRKQKVNFALSLHFWAPHANAGTNADGDRTWLPLSPADLKPFESLVPRLPEPDYPQLDVTRTRRMIREYAASIHSVDRNVGRLLDELDRLQLTNNTLVIFTSDHGYNLGHHAIWHKGNGRWLLKNNRGPRANMWDHSLRVPAIVSWPERIAEDTTVSQTVSHLDWFPTILSAAGIDQPEGVTLRGDNILPALTGGTLARAAHFFAQYRMRPDHADGADMRSMQTDRWKLVRFLRGRRTDEFYDRRSDPDENTNLYASENPEVRAAIRELDALLTKKMREIDDPGVR